MVVSLGGELADGTSNDAREFGVLDRLCQYTAEE